MSEHQSGMPGIVKTSLQLLGVFVVLMIALTVFSKVSFRSTTKTVTIAGRGYDVLVANTPEGRYQGLSGKTIQGMHAEGMIFTFPTVEERTFEMRRMLFPLDFLWVHDGLIVKIDQDIPAPKGKEKPAKISSAPYAVETVFEFPAGFVKTNHLNLGDSVLGVK
ncbi:MAG: DUF192 domain-containing protein [Patescibacteria group bacterium]|jgi:hypothetical protein